MTADTSETEIELKLLLSAEDVARFRRNPLIHRHKTGRAISRRMLAVYFDTADCALCRRKAALRIRQEGKKRVQTVKMSNGTAAGLQSRHEFNAPTANTEPDPNLIGDARVRELLERVVAESGPLQAAFTTDVDRTIWNLEYKGAVIELVLDRGAIASDGRTLPICEAELEMKSGPPEAALDFAEALLDRVTFTIGSDSKAARGYRLFRNTGPKVVTADSPEFDADATAREALVAILREGTIQLFDNRPVILMQSDIEGVHQARVAVRRMRAALDAFGPLIDDASRKSLGKRLKFAQTALGTARDWDVFVEETLYPLRDAGAGGVGFAKFLKRAEKFRRRAYRKAGQALHSRKYAKLQLALCRFPYVPNPTADAVPIGEFAARLLEERHRAVLLAGGDNAGDLETESLHALRIEVKKLRYAAEFFRTLYGKRESKALIKACKSLQDHLGALNDAVLQDRLIAEMRSRHDDLDLASVDLLRGRQQRLIAEGLDTLGGTWAAFRVIPPYWEISSSLRGA